MVIDAQQVLTETLYESDKILKTAGANTATIITHTLYLSAVHFKELYQWFNMFYTKRLTSHHN